MIVGLLGLAGFAVSTPVLAGSPGASRATTARVAGPAPEVPTAPPASAAIKPAARVATPVTRALVRARIAAIDPAEWLARFGEVDDVTRGHGR